MHLRNLRNNKIFLYVKNDEDTRKKKENLTLTLLLSQNVYLMAIFEIKVGKIQTKIRVYVSTTELTGNIFQLKTSGNCIGNVH